MPACKRTLLEQAWNNTADGPTRVVDWLDTRFNHGSLSEVEMRKYRRHLSIAKRYTPSRPRRLVAIVMAAIAFAASKCMYDQDVSFDTDSDILGIDNRCTACISPYLEDFETAPDETTVAIKGFGGSKTQGARKGTIVWQFADDLGAVPTFRIPNSYYVPPSRVSLI
jgi:hypothetical protein